MHVYFICIEDKVHSHIQHHYITSLPTGGSVTLIITQDGTGSRTATFGTDGSTAVKFPGGSSTLSTGANYIDVVTIVNDGTNFLGNCDKDYS